MKSARIVGIVSGVTILLLLSGAALAKSAQPQPVVADELARETAAHELAAVNSSGHYRYRFQEETGTGSETRDMVETRDWLLGRVLLKNGKPLPPAERREEDERLQGMLKNPDRLEAFRREESEHRELVRKMIAAFPDAFICEYAGTERWGPLRGMVRLNFRPRPKYELPSMEMRPLQGMRGSAWVDPARVRLVRIDARFFRDVDFGWGILGKIERGGSFVLEQQPVDGERWAMSMVAMHYNKRVLFMRSRVDSVTRTYEFRRIPVDMTLREGVEELLGTGEKRVASSLATK